MHPSDETDDYKEVCRSLFRGTAGESCTMTPLTDWYNNTTSGRGRHQLNQWIQNTIHSLTGQQAARRRRQSGLVWLSCWASTQRVTSRIPVPTIAPSNCLSSLSAAEGSGILKSGRQVNPPENAARTRWSWWVANIRIINVRLRIGNILLIEILGSHQWISTVIGSK